MLYFEVTVFHNPIPTNYNLQSRQHALETSEDTIQNMGIHCSITGKTMIRITSKYMPYNNCYYSSSEPVADEEDEL